MIHLWFHLWFHLCVQLGKNKFLVEQLTQVFSGDRSKLNKNLVSVSGTLLTSERCRQCDDPGCAALHGHDVRHHDTLPETREHIRTAWQH